MTQTVNIAEPEAVSFAELRKPEVRRVVVHRKSVPLDEQPVSVHPLVSGLFPVAVLLRFELPEHFHYDRRKLY